MTTDPNLPGSPLADRRARLLLEPSGTGAASSAQPIDHVRRSLSRSAIAPELSDPDRAFAILEAQPTLAHRLRHLLTYPAEHARAEVVRRCFQRAETTPSADPEDALCYAQIGLAATSLLPEHLSSERRNLLIRGHLCQANALRISIRLEEAHAALAGARRLLRASPCSDLVVPFHIRSASLAFYRQRHGDALRHLDRAQQLLPRDDHEAARVFTLRAWILGSAGDLPGAEALLRRASRCVAPHTYQEFSARNAHIRALLQLGRPEEARALYRTAGHIYDPAIHPRGPLYRNLARALLATGFEDHEEASRHFHRAHEQAAGYRDHTFVAFLRLCLAANNIARGRHQDAAADLSAAYPQLAALALPAPLERSLALLRPALEDSQSPAFTGVLPGLLRRLVYTPLIPAAVAN